MAYWLVLPLDLLPRAGRMTLPKDQMGKFPDTFKARSASCPGSRSGQLSRRRTAMQQVWYAELLCTRRTSLCLGKDDMPSFLFSHPVLPKSPFLTCNPSLMHHVVKLR